MILSCLLALMLSTDTIEVGRAGIQSVQPIHTPYSTDSTNMKGQAFDIKEVMNANNSMIGPKKNYTGYINNGDALTIQGDSLPVLRLLEFTVQTPHFTKANIEMPHLKNCKVFLNNEACNGKELTLLPGRSTIQLQTFTTKADKDSFLVKLTGEGLKDLQVNPEGKLPFSIGQQTWGEHYRSVALSPSGKYLVTISYYARKDGSTQYFTTLTEMATGKELLHRNEYVQMQWLADKDVLYFTQKGSKGRELVFYTPSTRKEEVIANNLPEGSFTLSPNADYIVFNKTEEGKGSKDGLKHIIEPDDRQEGWRNRNTLWRYDLKSGLTERLTFGKASVSLADVSNDGKYLLLQYSRSDMGKSPFYRTTLVRMNAYTYTVDTLLADTTFINSACFSPDGQSLLISASPAALNGIGSEVKEGQTPQGFDYRLFLYDIASQKTAPLLKHFNPSVGEYVWSKGDGMIYFVADDRMGRSLFRLNPRTEQVTRYQLPISYIQDFSISTSSKSNPYAVLFGQSAQRARDMYTCQLSSKTTPATKHIGFINFDELYKNVAIGKNVSWQFKATRGDSIDGFYILPPNFDQTKKYPMIVYYYGGCSPSANVLEAWYPFQTFAAQGYVVYVLNPSGTTAYGQEFAARHVGTWGDQSGDDIIEGVKLFCQQHPFVDKTKIGCIGASYGGFMTEYLQTRTDIFAAAISHAGISNIASYWGGGYWGYSYGEVAQYRQYPWNASDLYVKHSPLFNADKIHTPLLLLHGTVDTNVPTNESQQLYTALKILGRDVAYVQVEGENHVVTNPNKRLVWLNTIYAWFAKYLKGDDAWWKSLSL